MKEKYDNDHEKYTEHMVEQIKNNIKEQNQLRDINQQQNSILQNQESTFQHWNDAFTKSVNDTNDLVLDNEMLQYKFNTVNKQPEVYKATKTQQEKLAKAKTTNERLNTNLELQKETKKLQLNNALIEATNGILNNETKNENNLLNINNDVFESAFSNQLDDIVEMKKNLNKEQEKARILHQRKNEKKRHEETITSHQAKMNVLTNNNNNNNDDETMAALQVNYQIEENNRKEEKELYKRIQCAQIVKDINELKAEKDPNGSVW